MQRGGAIGRRPALINSARAIALLVMALAVTAPAAPAQPVDPLETAEAMLRISEYRHARELFEQALETARNNGEDAKIARALIGLAEVSQRQGRAADGRAAAVEAMAIAEQLDDDQGRADAHLRIALIELAERNRGEATRRLQMALGLYEKVQYHRGIAAVTVRLADMSDGEIEEQRVLYERAAAHARLGGDPRVEGIALHTLADRLFTVSRYQEALDLLTRAAAAFESAGTKVALGTVYNSIGRVYRAHGRLDEALHAQRTALAMHRDGGDPFALVQSLNAVAVVQQRRAEYDAAKVTLQEAIDVAAGLSSTPGGLRAQDFLKANMAALLSEVGDYAAAAATIEQVIASDRDSFPAVRYTQLSNIYATMGRGPDALTAAERAISLCGNDTLTCIGALNARANALAAAGDREAALRDLSQTLQRLEEIRGRLVPSDFLKQGFTEAYRRYYNSAIAQQFEANLARESLESAELARSRAFLDLLASRAIAPAAGGIRLQSPVAYAAATSADLVGVAQRMQSTMILFWVSDAEAFTWVVTPEGQIHARRAAITRARLAALVRETAPFADGGTGSRSSATATLKDSSAAWRRLHTLLIEPIRPLLPKQSGALLTILLSLKEINHLEILYYTLQKSEKQVVMCVKEELAIKQLIKRQRQ
jgi:tetratricopeptide (TPR) repeat protein